MANGVNAPFGLKPVRTLTSATFTGATNTYQIKFDTTESFFTGDAVALQSPLDQATPANAGFLKRWVQTDDAAPINQKIYPNIGVLQQVHYIQPDGTPVFSPSWITGTPVLENSTVDAFVYDDPNIIWQVQVSNFAALNTAANQLTTLTRDRIGNYGNDLTDGDHRNIPLALAVGGANGNPATNGNINTGASYAYLDLSVVITNTLRAPRYLCIGLAKMIGNDLGVIDGAINTNPFNIAEVIMIDHAARVFPPYSTTFKFT